MTDFWDLPYGVMIEAEDAQIPRLEVIARNRDCEWDWQFDGDRLHFRFASELAAKQFELWAEFFLKRS